MWNSSSSVARHINCGLPPEFFFVAPSSSFQNHQNLDSGSGGGNGFEPQSLTVSSAMVSVIPLLTATPCLTPLGISADEDLLTRSRGRGEAAAAMQLWQNPPGANPPPSSSYLIKPVTLEHANLLHAADGASASIGISQPSLDGANTCQDCGNQAKKDCPHRRCRTCCKSRGYDCNTHVKSTWVPAARRRERQLMASAVRGSSPSTSGTKKPRLGAASQTTTTASHTSTSNTTPRSVDSSSSHQDASFKESLPSQVRAPAVFKCVKVTAVDDGEDEYAYQALVRIGGHVFKGFLYDQGVEGSDALPNLSELHLSGGSGGRSANTPTTLPATLDPSDHIYSASGGGLPDGSSYGNPVT